MALQVSAVQTALSRSLRDITDVTNATFSEWCSWANQQTYDFLLGVDPTPFFLTQNYTLSAAPQTSALPATFKTIQTDGCGFFRQEADGTQTDQRLTRTGFGSSQPGYYINGINVVFTGIDNGDVYALRYIRSAVVIDDLTDYFTVDNTLTGVEIVPDEYLEFLIEDLKRLYFIWDEDSSSESLSDFRFVRLRGELGRNIRREPNVYAIPDFTRNY